MTDLSHIQMFTCSRMEQKSLHLYWPGLLTSLVGDELLGKKFSPHYKLVLGLFFILFWFYVCFLTTRMSHTQRHHAAIIFGEKQTQLVV